VYGTNVLDTSLVCVWIAIRDTRY